MKAKIRQWHCTVKYNEKGILSSRTAYLIKKMSLQKMLLFCLLVVNVATLPHRPLQMSAGILYECVEVGTQPHDDIELLEVHDRLQLGDDVGGCFGHEYPLFDVGIGGEIAWMLLGIGCEDGVDSIEAHEFLFAEPWA